MIVDKISNYKLYSKINEKFETAFKYITETDLFNLPDGKYEIDGENLFALVQEYNTKNESDLKPESHFHYIDIQYMISGSENIGIAVLENQKPVIVDAENDYAFYECATHLLLLKQGMFAVFFPDDLHMPGIKIKQSEKVKKLVLKLRIN
jgi:YhcH/YjgK/YiaL family protein